MDQNKALINMIQLQHNMLIKLMKGQNEPNESFDGRSGSLSEVNNLKNKVKRLENTVHHLQNPINHGNGQANANRKRIRNRKGRNRGTHSNNNSGNVKRRANDLVKDNSNLTRNRPFNNVPQHSGTNFAQHSRNNFAQHSRNYFAQHSGNNLPQHSGTFVHNLQNVSYPFHRGGFHMAMQGLSILSPPKLHPHMQTNSIAPQPTTPIMKPNLGAPQDQSTPEQLIGTQQQ